MESKSNCELISYIKSLESELLEIQQQSKEYESELENAILDKDHQLAMQLEKIAYLQSELSDFKQKYLTNEREVLKLTLQIECLTSRLKQFEDQKRELESLNDQWENSNRILEYSKQDLEEKLYHAEEHMIMYKEELGEVKSQKEVELQRLRDEVNELKQDLKIAINLKDEASRITQLETQLNETFDEISMLEQSIDPIQSSFSCSISVYVKIRPILESDVNKTIAIANSDNEIFISSMKKPRQSRQFLFQKVFGLTDSLDSLYTELLPAFTHFSKGNQSCILCYGQTGSGKTFTMTGLLSKFLIYLSTLQSNDFSLSLHCIEIYNEQVKDLLSNSSYSRNWKNILSISKKSLEDKWMDRCGEYLEKAASKRITKSTEANEVSSRSHCIYTFVLTKGKEVGIMQFVDLAGSERVTKSGVFGSSLKETLHINKSLSALQDVIVALENKSGHIPYRNSLLTRLLKPSLSGKDSKVTVILNCSPTEESVNESLSTLLLGLRLKTVDLGFEIRKNLKNEEVERTLTLLEKERNEKVRLLRQVDKLERDIDGYVVAIKDKDNKIVQLMAKIKNSDKSKGEEGEMLKKELEVLKGKQVENEKKLRSIRMQAENEKIAKNKALIQLKNKNDQIKRVMSAGPYSSKRSPSEKNKIYAQSRGASRIPLPKSCNSSKFT